MTKNIIPVFIWAKANGDVNIIDRILVKTVLELLKNDIEITQESINNNEIIEVDIVIYDFVKETAQKLVGSSYEEK